MKKYHKTACANLPGDEHLVVQNFVKDNIIELE
jgi:hypothetical protein